MSASFMDYLLPTLVRDPRRCRTIIGETALLPPPTRSAPRGQERAASPAWPPQSQAAIEQALGQPGLVTAVPILPEKPDRSVTQRGVVFSAVPRRMVRRASGSRPARRVAYSMYSTGRSRLIGKGTSVPAAIRPGSIDCIMKASARGSWSRVS